jgi:type IV secretion system protein VirB1
MRIAVILPMAVVTTLAVTCAPQVAPAMLAAIAQTESGLDPLAIGDNTAHRSYHPSAKAEALSLAAQLAAAGHDLDLGLMQINHRNFGWLGLVADDAFEPCRSLAAGAAVLTALSRYNTGSPRAGFDNGYVARVVAAARGEASAAQTPLFADKVQAPNRDRRDGWNLFPDETPGASQSAFLQRGDQIEQTDTTDLR